MEVAPIDVWFVRPEAIPPARLDRFMEWLSPEERAKHARFASAELQREYLVTRALSRWALTRRVPAVTPAEWHFERTAAGRPFVPWPQAPTFNLSNTAGLVVCAVRAAGPIGVDVERSDLAPDLTALLAPGEAARLRALPDAERSRRAVELWTVKEAYLKAEGEGIGRRMNRVEVTRRETHAGLGEVGGWVRYVLPERAWDLAVRTVAHDFVLAVVSRPEAPGTAVSIAVRPGLETGLHRRDAT